MNESIVELARECGAFEVDGKIAFYTEELEAFYRLAYNKALKDAIDATDSAGGYDRALHIGAIRKLEIR